MSKLFPKKDRIPAAILAVMFFSVVLLYRWNSHRNYTGPLAEAKRFLFPGALMDDLPDTIADRASPLIRMSMPTREQEQELRSRMATDGYVFGADEKIYSYSQFNLIVYFSVRANDKTRRIVTVYYTKT